MEVGAANFSYGGCATGNALCEPSGVAIDPSGNVWAGDGQNASVQEFKAPFSLGEHSSVLLGGFYLSASTMNASTFGPNGLAFDPSGNLWVADGGFNRVLEFTPPFTSRMAASVVIGQSNFTSVSNKNNQSMLNGPGYITFDHSGNLWVSDTYDNRVLEFKAPFSNGESASIALGQPSLSSTLANTTQSTLDRPAGIAFDTHGNLWVSDESNNRIVEFVPPFSTGMSATVVIGSTSYFFPGSPVAGNSSVYDPEGLAAGPNGNLWVDDSGNYRVLLFVDPASAASSSTTSTTFTPTIPVTTTTSKAVSSSQVQTTSTSSSSIAPVTSVSSAASATSSSTSSANLPEFPYQFVVVGIFTLVLAGAYLFSRRRSGRD